MCTHSLDVGARVVCAMPQLVGNARSTAPKGDATQTLRDQLYFLHLLKEHCHPGLYRLVKTQLVVSAAITYLV